MTTKRTNPNPKPKLRVNGERISQTQLNLMAAGTLITQIVRPAKIPDRITTDWGFETLYEVYAAIWTAERLTQQPDVRALIHELQSTLEDGVRNLGDDGSPRTTPRLTLLPGGKEN